jgi:hypothetical protein
MRLSADTFDLEAAEVGQGLVPLAVGGLSPAEQLLEGIGSGGIGEIGGAQGIVAGILGGYERAVELILDPGETALVPGGLDDGIYQGGFDGTLGSELGIKLRGEVGEELGIFSGDDERGGVGSMLQSIEAGSGLALSGAGAGGFLRIQAIGGDLCGRCHTTTR